MSGPQSPNDFEKELTNMSILKQIRHPKIIPLLAAYSYHGKYNLIFPRADGGSLKRLLSGETVLNGLDTTESMMVAVAGLSSAICKMHDLVFDSVSLIGCHCDLKPDNILVDKSNLVLADFGLSRFKPSDESSRSEFQQAQGEYLAPECEDLGFKELKERRRVGRSRDVWALGCILLELLTYLLMGSDGVTEFRSERKQSRNGISTTRFYIGNGKPHPGVLKWQEKLEQQISDKLPPRLTYPKVLQCFSSLIRRVLDTNPEARPKAADIEVILRGLAICSLSQDIRELFEVKARSHLSELPLQEMRRFESWLAVCKIDYNLQHSDFTKSWLGRSFSDFGTIIHKLYELRNLLRAFFQEQAQEQAEQKSSRYRSSQRKSPGRFYKQLNRLNNALLGLLPSENQTKVDDHFALSMLADSSLKFLEDMTDKSEVFHQGDLLSRLACIKLWSNKIETGSGQPSLIVRQSDVTLKGIHDDILNVDYRGTKTLLEHKPFRDSMVDNLKNLQNRLENMARLLQKASGSGFPVLSCPGVYVDPGELKMGLLYDFPRNSESGAPFHSYKTLAAILEKPEQTRWPLLGERFKLAFDLANSLFEFLKTSWLHRNVRTSNIAFFHNGNILWEQLSIFFLGFAHSRPMTDEKYTEGPPEDWDENYYLDPDYVWSTRFKPYHDHYSLGVVLLEIGYWEPLSQVCGDMVETGKSKHTDFREHALNKLVPRLGIHLGATYRDVVRVCLDGTLREGYTRAEDDATEKEKSNFRLQERFKELVVDKLKGLSV